MAAGTPAQGRASKTLGHLRITIRHFLGRGVQGVAVAGSTGRVARRPGMPPVGQNRAQDLFEAREAVGKGGLAKTRPAILCGPLQGMSRPSPGVPTRPSATAQASDWASRELRAASNVSSSIEPITGGGASVMRYWALRLGREARPCILSRGRRRARGEPAGELNGWSARSHGMNTGKRPGAASVPWRLPAGQGCCLRCLRQPHSHHVREGHPEQRADTLCDRGRDERPR